MVDPGELRDVFDRTVGLPPADRPAFLEQACGGNAALRREIERLLDADARGASAFNTVHTGEAADASNPDADSRRLSLPPGTRLGPYQIAAPIGAGGMGEVYKARDTRLDRTVAIKVLSSGLTQDPTARQRFDREARAVAGLSHPHICSLFDIGHQDGTDFLVMEYLAGETLATRLARGKLALDQALTYASEIAQALNAAHRAGIIHRDLKPGNVMVTANGIKLLDFGLAKRRHAPVASDVTVEHSKPLTRTGMILGTVQYMAPEQLEGREADERTDIFAFGVVLYEMVTGRRAFEGASDAALIGKILHADAPSASSSAPLAPPALDELVRICLAKDPAARCQSISEVDARLATIRDVARYSASATHPVTASPTAALSKRRRTAIALSVGLLGLAGFLSFRNWSQSGPTARTSPPEPVITRLTANPAELPVTSARISPDGRYVAFADPTGIQVRQIDTGETQRVPDTRAMSVYGWSGDSATVRAGACEGTTCVGWDVSVVGGARRRSGAAWVAGDDVAASPDGSRILRRSLVGEVRLDLLDGSPSRVIATYVLAAKWSNDGSRILIVQSDGSAIESWSLEPSVHVTVFTADKDHEIREVLELPNGRMIAVLARHPVSGVFLGDECSLWELRTDGPGRVVTRVRRLTAWNEASLQHLSVSADATRFVYVNTSSQGDVYVAGFEPLVGLTDPPRRLTLDDRYDVPTAWTPDIASVLFHTSRNRTADIFKQRLDSLIAEPLVVASGEQADPRVTSDGQWVLFKDLGFNAPFRIMRVPITGGTPQQLFSAAEGSFHCSALGRCVVMESQGSEIVLSSLDPIQGKGLELARIPQCVTGANLMPDGEAFAFIPACDTGPRNRIRIVSFRGAPTRDILVRNVANLETIDWLPSALGAFSTEVTPTLSNLLFITPDGNSRVLWSSAPWVARWTVPSPDGKRVAMLVMARQSNVAMLTSF